MTPDGVLERDYARLRPETLSAVRSKLRASGISYPDQDLEAFYNQAWHALYDRMVAGEEIANVTGFLVQVAYRRAVDDFRRLRPDERAELDAATLSADDDVVERLDDQRRLREFVAALRDELGERERLAATLCYVHGYTRAEAARVMGLSEGRMKKVMDEVSRAVARFTAQISAGERCEVGASRTKAYALGLLDPDGERYRAARAHLDECPACRAEVLRLRGLAAIAPPALLPWAALTAGGGGGAAGAAGGRLRRRPDRGSKTTAAVAAAVAAVVAVAVAGAVVLTGDDEPAPAAAVAEAPASSSSSSSSPSPSSSPAPAAKPQQRGSARAAKPRQASRRAAPRSAGAEPAGRSRAQARDADGGDRSSARGGSSGAPAAAAPAATAAPAPAPTPAPVASPSPTPAPAPTPPPPPADSSPPPAEAPPEQPTVDETGVQEFGIEP